MERKIAAVTHPGDGSTVFVVTGIPGYLLPKDLGIVDPKLAPDTWNKAHGVSEAEAIAMRHGSMFGWNTPGANPDNWRKEINARRAH